MGNINRKRNAEGIVQSNQIEDAMLRDQKANENTYKVLLLGAGGGGKSTITKQVRRLYATSFDTAERESWAENIRRLAMRSLHVLGKDAQGLGEEDSKFVNTLAIVLSRDSIDSMTDVKEGMRQLWDNPAVQAVFARSFRQNNHDRLTAAAYYLDKVETISDLNWTPDDQDILRARVKTTGTIEVKFSRNGQRCLLVDVGGQRSERRKWIHCFDGVDRIFFVVSLTEYDEILFEAEENRLDESLHVFKSTIRDPHLQHIPITILFNKVDAFTKQIQHPERSFSSRFPDFQGDAKNPEECIAHVKSIFQNLVDPDTHTVDMMHLTALEDASIHKLFDAVAPSTSD